MRLRIPAIALVLTAGSALAEGAPEVSTDLSVTLKPQQYRICNDRPARPAWMDELHPRQAYKALTLQKLYELKNWQAIVATGDCSCANRFPDWESAEAEYREKYEHLPQADHTQVRLTIRNEQQQLASSVEAICRDQGNW